MLAALPLAAPAAAGPDEVVRLFIVLAIMLAAGKFSGELFDRIGQPAVLGELLAGAVLGGSALGIIPSSPDDPLYGVLHVLAEIGVIVLLFEIGLETDLKQLLRVGPGAASVALVGVALPFAAGFLYWISPVSVADFNVTSASTTAIFLGAALTATSVGITARVLTDLKIFRTTEAQMILGAAVLDDVLGLVLLGLVATLAAGGSVGVVEVGRALGIALGFLAVALGLGLLMAPRVFATIDRMRVRGVLLVSAFAFVLIVSALAQVAGSAMIIGAFAAGIILSGTNQFDAIESQMAPLQPPGRRAGDDAARRSRADRRQHWALARRAVTPAVRRHHDHGHRHHVPRAAAAQVERPAPRHHRRGPGRRAVASAGVSEPA
ncbi:MAG: cation:proton antiporter [Gemmatimonadetes bacterium]|nr:cation:proton antiporter [Gemmatimonadota bacterium]